MNAIEQKLAQLQRVIKYVPVALRKVLISQSEFIEELNRSQLKEGKKSDGSSFPEYSNVSKEYFGKPDGAIKLYDTGDLYDSMESSYFDDSFDLENVDSKVDMLTERYGEFIGLTKESIEKLKEVIKPLLAKEIKAFYKSI